MEELIKIQIHDGESVVSARELHYFLESKREFATWIKDRISKYGFVENQDYTVFDEIVKNSNGGRPSRQYALTIDTAKEIAMVEGNDKGKQARQYFIECERRSKNPVENLTRLDIAKLLLESETEKQRLLEENNEKERRISAMRPKEIFSDSVSESKGSILVKELAGYLNQKGVNIGQNRLFEWLRANGYLCVKGDYYNLPTQKSLDMKLFEVIKRTINKPGGDIITSTTTKVTGKGQIYFVNKFASKMQHLDTVF